MKKYLLIFLFVFAIIQTLLRYNDTLYSDEGTHGIIALFYKDFLLNLKIFRSVNDILDFATAYAIKYPKITPMYPPLYHIMLMSFFLIKESILMGRILNIFISAATGYVIFLLCSELLKSKKLGFVSMLFFFCFSTIFNHSSLLMMDMLQIFTFSLVILLYIKMKKKRVVKKKDVIVLGILLAIASVTKFFSIFLFPVILLDSLLTKKRILKYIFASMIICGIIVSPYYLIYLKLGLHKFAFKVATTSFQSRWVYFNFFENFGLIIGPIVFLSIIWFLWKNRKNVLILTWFFMPLMVFLSFKDSDFRFAYIIIPVYAASCGFFVSKLSRMKYRKMFLIGIGFLIIAQTGLNIYQNWPTYFPVEDMFENIDKSGNILILSERPVYSSVYIFYGRINHVKGNIIRPCVLKNDLTQDFLEEWGVRYIIDQNSIVDDKTKYLLGLNLVKEKISETYHLKLFETKIDRKVDCNYICRLERKVCKDQGIAGFLSLI